MTIAEPYPIHPTIEHPTTCMNRLIKTQSFEKIKPQMNEVEYEKREKRLYI